MRQILAIFHDAYRELNAKRLFWITMILSALVALSFLAVGIDDNGLSIFGTHWNAPISTKLIERPVFYKGLYASLGIGIWLTFATTILAVISTSSTFPELLSSGAIDLYLSKPLGRLKLFLTKYFAGLGFVLLQVLAFSSASFLVLGIRGGTWEPGVFLAVPLTVLFYSYLHCVCVLVGVVTRSTIAAILLTAVFWGAIFGVHMAESALLFNQIEDQVAADRFGRIIAFREGELRELQSQESTPYRETKKQFAQKKLDEAKAKREKVLAEARASWHRFAYPVKTVLPKTSETVALLNRWVTRAANLKHHDPDFNDPIVPSDDGMPTGLLSMPGPDRAKAEDEFRKVIETRSIGWVIGTSLGFEAVIMGVAAWVFCRRDY